MTVGHHETHRVELGAVLDIGGDIGALLLTAGPELAGAEVQLYAVDGRCLTHTEVHPRDMGGRTVHAGLFPSVPEGEYDVEPRLDGPRVRVRVKGGEVTTLPVTG